MKTAAVIVAAGRGRRAGGDIPKQYQMLADKPVLAHSVLAFARHVDIDAVVVVLHPDDAAIYGDLVAPHLAGLPVTTCEGGASRSDSVLNGLRALPGDTGAVLIHDGARPLVTAALISRVIAAVFKTGAAAPAMPVSDTIWRAEAGQVHSLIRRQGLFAAQTPQGFHLADILAAHQGASGPATDDVELALTAGLDVSIVSGSARNLKITMPGDLRRANTLMGGEMDIRTGNGFDVHAFEAGDHITLCGIKIPHDQGLAGHSDADVAMHALTDAIYGALAKGDIGQWFPPSEPRWKGAASEIFLRHAVALALDEDFTITHLDCTIICETPKIGPHSNAMRARLAGLIGINADRISIKATTSERLGFTGRGEGIAALATATLLKPGKIACTA